MNLIGELIDDQTPLTVLLQQEHLQEVKAARKDRIELSREFLTFTEYVVTSLWFGIQNGDCLSPDEIVTEAKTDRCFAAACGNIRTPEDVLAIVASAIRKMVEHSPSVEVCVAALHTHRHIPPGQHHMM